MSDVPEPPALPAPPRRETRRDLTTAALMLLMALAAMEQTVTATAMYSIIRDLHGIEHYALVPAVYLLAATVLMPLYGRLADVLGRKRVIMGAVALFTLGSIAAAFSASMPQLIACRAIQGLGAGGIMPVVLTILGDIFTVEQRARMQGLFSAVWGIASLAGPLLGAFLVQTLGWPSIFWVNFPFGLLGMAILAVNYHEHEKPHSTNLDFLGVAALALGSGALLMFCHQLGAPGQSWTGTAPAGVIAVAALAFFTWHEYRTPHPIMPPHLLLTAAIGPAVFASLLMGGCVFSLDTYVPLFVQGGRGGNALAAAWTVTPVMLAWSLSSFAAGKAIVNWGFRQTALIGSILILLGFLVVLVCATLHFPTWTITLALVLAGLGFGPASMSYLLCAQDAVAWQQRGVVTSTVAFARTIGGALAIGVLGAILNFAMRRDLATLAQQGVKPSELLDPRANANVPPDLLALAQRMIAHGLLYVFAAMAALALLQLAASTLMSKARHKGHLKPSEALEASV